MRAIEAISPLATALLSILEEKLREGHRVVPVSDVAAEAFSIKIAAPNGHEAAITVYLAATA